MKKVSLIAIAIALASPASAADMAPRTYTKAPVPAAIYSWTGFYVGGNIGGAWQDVSSTYTGMANVFAAGLFDAAILAGALPSHTTQQAGGFLGGLQAGYNVQNGTFVYGVEADANWLNARGSSTVNTNVVALFYPPITTITEAKTEWLATVRGRAGVLAAPQTLLYVTGGLAVGGVRGSTTITPTPCATNAFCSAGSFSDTRWGWTAGGGLEQAFASQWSVKFEYLYYDLGTASYTANEISPAFPAFAGNPNVRIDTKFTGHIGRIGLNYKFGGPVVAKY
jgi:outer membrane immunogenic protein